MRPALFRAAAVVIALLAAIDPALTSTRRTRPVVSVIPSSARVDSAAADGVAQGLARSVTVVRAPFAAAEGVVIVGTTRPAGLDGFSGPVFAATPVANSARAIVTSATHPRVATLESRVPVTIVVRATGARGRRLIATLSSNGVLVDRAELAVAGDDELIDTTLMFVAAAPGLARLRVSTAIDDDAPTGAADLVLDVREHQWAVLFVDGRPSWMSTFVRRAVERDPSVSVTSRVVTSRGISTETGRAPGTLADPALLEAFDAIVVGAPELLTDRDVAGLEVFLRRRGGAVVLLFDQTERRGTATARLLRAGAWTTAHTGNAAPVRPADAHSGWLRSARLVWPATLPAIAEPFALDSVGARAIVWRVPVGAGTLVVSGATDAWHARDPELSGFDAFWQTLLVDASAGAVPPVELRLQPALAEPGERITATATFRDWDGPSPSMVTGRLGGQPVRFWRGELAGQYVAHTRAPDERGVHPASVAAGGAGAQALAVVDADVARPAPDDRVALASWVRASGGDVVPASDVRVLRASLERAVAAQQQAVTWHPMRSPWWIVPFALLLGAEWWWRRRRGLA